MAKNMSKDKKRMKAGSPESRENQLIALAENLAEEQMRAGTASSQIIAHYLKQGSLKQELELEKLRSENELLKAKTDLVKATKSNEEMFNKAIAAMKMYQGIGGEVDDSQPEEY